jgi:hypothetical protein
VTKVAGLTVALCLLSAYSAFGQSTHDVETKSEGVAFLASFGCTVVPIVAGAVIIDDPDQATTAERTIGGALGLAGWIVGPGVGHVYAGNNEAYMTGFAVRLIGVSVAVMGALAADGSGGLGSNGGEFGTALVMAGGLVVVAGAVADIIRAPVLVHKEKQTPRVPIARRFELQFTGTGLMARLNF